MKYSVLFFVLCLAFLACDNEDDFTRIEMVSIAESNIIDTVLLSESVSIEIKASAPNGCYSDLFAELEQINRYEFFAIAYGTFTCYEGGCACPTIVVQEDITINFTPLLAGEYIIHTRRNPFAIVSDTLIVVGESIPDSEID